MSSILARLHGADLGRCLVAAAAHDHAKGMGRDELHAVIDSEGIPVDPEDFGHVSTLHGPVGAWLARTRFGIDDAEVLEAIEFHSTGRDNPSATLQVLMSADYTEPTRTLAAGSILRAEVRRDLAGGLTAVLNDKISYLRSRGKPVHGRTLRALGSLTPGAAGTHIPAATAAGNIS